jgi:hypothetical protein
MTRLRALQLRFQDYLIGNSEDIEDDIVSTENALAEHRLGTYYNAYRIRLIDCLAVDYSALEKYLGREAFENLTLDYLSHYPSTHPSVRWFGQNLPAYMQHNYQGPDAEFLRELVSFEWAKTLVFDAADSPRIFQLEDMSGVPGEAWPSLKFEFKPAIQYRDLHWNVPAIASALNENNEQPEKNRQEYPQRWLIWRQQMNTHWRSLDVHEAWAFDQAVKAANFAEICEGLLEWVDEQQVALVAAGFLKQWVSDQLLVTLEFDR